MVDIYLHTSRLGKYPPLNIHQIFTTFVNTSCNASGYDVIQCENFRIPKKEYDVRNEPKFIIFYTQLVALFQFCRLCNSENTVDVNAHGTMAEVVSTCPNPECGHRTTWSSQPNFPGTKIPAGNLLLSFGIFVAGASATKVFRVFNHIGMTCFSLTSFFKHQRVSCFTVLLC